MNPVTHEVFSTAEQDLNQWEITLDICYIRLHQAQLPHTNVTQDVSKPATTLTLKRFGNCFLQIDFCFHIKAIILTLGLFARRVFVSACICLSISARPSFRLLPRLVMSSIKCNWVPFGKITGTTRLYNTVPHFVIVKNSISDRWAHHDDVIK